MKEQVKLQDFSFIGVFVCIYVYVCVSVPLFLCLYMKNNKIHPLPPGASKQKETLVICEVDLLNSQRDPFLETQKYAEE